MHWQLYLHQFFINLFFIGFNNYLLTEMGNDTCSGCGTLPSLFSKDFDVPNLQQRSTYGETRVQPDEKIIKAIFAENYNPNRSSTVANMIAQHNQRLFEDPNFKVDSKETSRLSVFFDFKRNKTRIYTTKAETDITSFLQLNVEFSYLTSVCYFLCRKDIKAHFIKHIIQTHEPNDYGAYSLNFYCNGEPHPIVIDDKMPTKSDSFVNLRIVTGYQLWPLLIEKAWCKQIGSYERAKGLSPQDAFEQITGVPSYTYSIRLTNRSFIKQLLKDSLTEGYWVTLVARNNLTDLKSRQVFYLQSLEANDSYTVISPYTTFSFQTGKPKRRGEFQIREDELFNHFEHVVVGYYKSNYILTSLPVQSKCHEELLFSVDVKISEKVSIRFNQFYAGYLQQDERINYRYSPVMLELYKVTQSDGDKVDYTLVQHCEGCNHSISGARSSQCSDGIFQVLEGRYILRLEVEWQHELLLHKGNLVTYASEGNVIVAPLKNNGQFAKEIYPSIIERQRSSKKLQVTPLKEHDLELYMYQKLHSVLLMFKNMSNVTETFKIDFSSSNNVLIRGDEVNGKSCTLHLEGLQSSLIEVLPQQLVNPMQINNFDVTKIEEKKQ